MRKHLYLCMHLQRWLLFIMMMFGQLSPINKLISLIHLCCDTQCQVVWIVNIPCSQVSPGLESHTEHFHSTSSHLIHMIQLKLTQVTIRWSVQLQFYTCCNIYYDTSDTYIIHSYYSKIYQMFVCRNWILS